MRVLVVNAGSSSLKVRLLDDDELIESYDELPDPPPQTDAVGHRVVHGGTRFLEPVIVDDEVEAALRDLVDLAPLHQPKSLHGIDAARALLPDVPHVACFDTAFHAHLPPAAATYPLPADWRSTYGLRKYGFHGLSHAWAARRAADLVPGSRRVVTCHLGAGASLAAVRDGVSVETTMGFTPLEGLVMATRPGRLDAGLVLWLQDHAGMSSAEIADVLEHSSGLTALAGTGDMRELLRRDDPDAGLAVDIYLHRLCAEIAAMTAALAGLDTLVFTGGVGENAAEIRLRATQHLSFLGVAVDPERNAAVAGVDADITAPGAKVSTLVVASREDLEIARSVRRVLG
ncbi:MAG TPA: acetate/propionate family kinase [Mycobacteriales bacterium]|nr:acetate/propionate family kinase [Mycobacteriales bacterium]